MRPSKRTQILDGAVRVVERGGVGALTYESVAAETGLTKGGLLYHFPTREALVDALHEHLAAAWEAGMVDLAGKRADEATAAERVAAYARVTQRPSSRAELALLLDAVHNPPAHRRWFEVTSRWAPPVPATGGPLTTEQLDALTTSLAADGLWLHDMVNEVPLPPDVRRQLAEHLARALDDS